VDFPKGSVEKAWREMEAEGIRLVTSADMA